MLRSFVATLGLVLVLAAGAAEPDPELREILRAAANDSPSFTDRFHAEVWLTDMSGRLKRQVADPEERIELLTLVHMEAARVQLPPNLILAVIEVESNFDRYAVSVAGALGLMQIMPFWKDEIGRPNDNLLHTSTNLRYGCTILRYYYDKENGDLRRALDRQIDIHRATMAEVMTRRPRTVEVDALAAEALKLMEDHRITGLLAIDADGRLVGALNVQDLLRAGVL